MSEIPPEQKATWLEKVHADVGLPARAFRLAFALSHAADAEGFIGPNALGKIARLEGTDGAVESFADLLGCLAAGGHIKACGKRRKIDGFRILLAKTSAAGPSKSATITPFPAARRTAFIKKHAERMASLTPSHSEADLRHQLKIQADTMRRRGISEETISREIRALESSIRAELWRVVLLPDQPSGPA
jgi:hypothetical protein